MRASWPSLVVAVLFGVAIGALFVRSLGENPPVAATRLEPVRTPVDSSEPDPDLLPDPGTTSEVASTLSPTRLDSETPRIERLGGFETELLELTLHAASIDHQLNNASKSLLARADPLWSDYWDSDQYEVVEKMTHEFMNTPDGRPKPMQVRQVGTETRVVVLPAALYPDVWESLENLTSREAEKRTVENELERITRERTEPGSSASP